MLYENILEQNQVYDYESYRRKQRKLIKNAPN